MGQQSRRFIGLALCALAAPAISVAAAVRVALMDFTSEDGAYRAGLAAKDLTTALYGQLPRIENIEWVERRQLELAASELELSALGRKADPAGVRVGKWVKADLLILGRLLSGGKNDPDARLEVIDLEGAEVLAERLVRFEEELKRPERPLADRAGLLSEELIRLIKQAMAERERRKGQIAVALLYLHHLAERWPEPFADLGRQQTEAFFPKALEKAFEQAVTAHPQLRLIRFPRPNRGLAEAELVVSGLVESEPQAWLKVADYYLWGDIISTNGWLSVGTRQQRESRLDIILHVWDGRTEPKTFREGPLVIGDGGLPEAAVNSLCEKLAARTLPLDKPSAVEPSDSVRQTISKVMEKHADAVWGEGHFAVFDSLENRARIGELLQSLELACFFDPTNQSAQRKLVTYRWGYPVKEHAKDKFRFAWQGSEAWGNYVEKFGFDAPPIPRNHWPLVVSTIAHQYVGSALGVAQKFLYWNTVPEDVPDSVLEEWQAGIAEEFVKRVQVVADRPEMRKWWPGILEDGLDWGARWIVPDAQLRAKLIDTAWPRYVNYVKETRDTQALQEIQRGISQTFTQLGKAGEQQRLFAMLGPALKTAAPSVRTRPAWIEKLSDSPKFTMPRVAALPPKLEAQPEKITLPLGTSRDAVYGYMPVHSLLYAGGKLWIAAAVEESAALAQVSPDLAQELTPARGKANRLWSYDPQTQQLHPASSALGGIEVSALATTGDQLWMAGQGVASLELASGEVRRFGVAEGLPVRDTEAVAFVREGLYTTGEGFKLFTREFKSERWSQLKLPAAAWSCGTGQPINMRGAHGKLLFLAGSAGLYDPDAGQWRVIPGVRDFHCCDADGSGFWLGGGSGLCFVDAKNQVVRRWESESGLSWAPTSFSMAPAPSLKPADPARAASDPVGVQTEIINGFKKFLAARKAVHARREKDHAVVEAAPPKTRLRGNITAVACDGDFLWLGCRDYYSYVLLLHTPSRSWVGHLVVPADATSLAVSDKHVWIGLSGGQDRLLQVAKSGLLATPRSKWVEDEIGQEEFAALIATLPLREQALHAFFTGDYATTASLLETEASPKRSLESLFLLAFSYDSDGLDRPAESSRYFKEIISRYPDSPWAAVAMELAEQSTAGSAKGER